MNIRELTAQGSVVISVLVAITFGVTLALAMAHPDNPALGKALDLMIGAVITNFTAVVQFWVGSSSGSQKKDDHIASLIQAPKQ